MTTGSSDLPEAARRRLGEGAFSSGLSVNDFAACLEMGLEPVGLVQGFCAMQWGAYGVGFLQRGMTPYGGGQGGYVENYQCPHGGMMGGEHRFWGQNYQQTWIENSWNEGFSAAYSRMLEEASDLHADGIVGVVDLQSSLSEAGIIEFHLTGTAVKLKGAPVATTSPWTTYLAGQRLAKLFEAGFAPVSVIATVSSVRVWAYCMTEFLMGGGGFALNQNFAPQEIDQIVRAQSAARSLARKNVHDQLHGDSLHGADLSVMEREFEKGDLEVQTLLRGNRVRRFKSFESLPVPQPTVRLS